MAFPFASEGGRQERAKDFSHDVFNTSRKIDLADGFKGGNLGGNTALPDCYLFIVNKGFWYLNFSINDACQSGIVTAVHQVFFVIFLCNSSLTLALIPSRLYSVSGSPPNREIKFSSIYSSKMYSKTSRKQGCC